MKKEERYKLASEYLMSSVANVRAFAKDILLKEGYNLEMINLSEEGITIKAFNKLVQSIYEVGYKDGVEARNSLKGEKKRVERQATELEKHGRTAKFMKETNQINNL